MPDPAERKLAAILSADVVGYSRLMAEDEDATVRTLAAYREEIGLLVRQHRGRVVDFTGDNFLAEFPTATDAAECAIEIQRVLAARNVALPPDRKMQFRIGIHLGEVRVEEDRLYGDGVNIAARLEGLAERGGICISATVHDQVRNKLDAIYQDLGDQTVKNIPDQVRAYRVEPRAWQPEHSPEVRPASRSRRLRTSLLATGTAVLLVGVGIWATWPRPLAFVLGQAGVLSLPVNPALPGKPSVAVLPFTNMSGDPGQEYFADGITEDLTTDLSRQPGLFVISRSSAFSYKGKPVKVEDVGRELGVRYVVEGSVRRAEDRVRITAQLIDATTGLHVWSDRYDRELDDIFALQSEISEAILVAVGVEIQEAELQRIRRKPTDDLTAYDAFTKGLYHFLRFTREDNAEARLFLEHAIELDPDYAEAYQVLGATLSNEYLFMWNLDPALRDRGEALNRRALELDPSLPQGHMGLGFSSLSHGRSADAIAHAEKAIALAPNFAASHFLLGLAQIREGRPLVGIQSIRRSMRLNPRGALIIRAGLAAANYRAGRTREAIEMWEQVRAAYPDSIIARIPLVSHYEDSDRHGDARVIAAEILRTNPNLTAETAARTSSGFVGLEDVAALTEKLKRAGLP